MTNHPARDSFVFVRYRNKAGRLQTQPTLSRKAPVHATVRRHYTADVTAKLLLQGRPPGHKLETETIIDHGEPTRRECDALAIDAGDVLAFGGRTMREASLSGGF